MECPKCHNIISDECTICPKCKKVLLLECPNCHSLGDSAICQNCGYTILVKCSKCSKITPASNKTCIKCGFSTKTSLAYQECETDEFATIIIKFQNLKKIRTLLKSKDLYSKFFYKLKNLLNTNLKNADGKLIIYDDIYTINLNKELSFPTSSSKAVRLAIKLINSFTLLNQKLINELKINLGLNIFIIKKTSEELQDLKHCGNNIKMLNVSQQDIKYLKGMQIVLDQYVRDEINKDYKTDSLYSTEEDGRTVMYYEIPLDSYVIPPEENSAPEHCPENSARINKSKTRENKTTKTFKVFDINAKCSFENVKTVDLINHLDSTQHDTKKIISIRSQKEYSPDISDIIDLYRKKDFKILIVSCTEKLNYKPWGFFQEILKQYFGIKFYDELNKINQNTLNAFNPIFDLLSEETSYTSAPEDIRFNLMEQWGKLLSLMNNTCIIISGFENLDDTSIQTLELYFNNYKKIKPNFIFLTSDKISLHSKIQNLLRTDKYLEITLRSSNFDDCISRIKSDAKDFIKSFYFEKLEENFNGSYLYFKQAISYLKETGVLIDFENKLIVKDSKSIVLPKTLDELFRARMKHLTANQELSLILAYSIILEVPINQAILEKLGITNIDKNIKQLVSSNFIINTNNGFFINNYNLFLPVFKASLQKEARKFIAKELKTGLGNLIPNSTYLSIYKDIDCVNDEYEALLKNSKFALNTGDYDAYLKNCLQILTLIENLNSSISKEDIQTLKNTIYNSILAHLYNYAPSKIYNIEKMLLLDAIRTNDNEKIIKLSNLMLQGALLLSNYTDALNLLHNILSRMPEPKLIVSGAINQRFLLLSLVHMEILYNIGNFKECTEIANELLTVITPDIIEKIKPASFSTNLFVSHLLETMKLAAFCKLYMLENDLDKFLEKVQISFGTELPEKDCILAIKDYLSGKVYQNQNFEEYSALSKTIFLILQEITILNGDYARFAQNIYQAKLLSSDIHQKEIEHLCDLLIGYAYFKTGNIEKAEFIYNDVINCSEQSAIFNTLLIGKYLLASLKYESSKTEDALILINDSLTKIRKYENTAKILYCLFEKLYIKIMEKESPESDLETEKQKLVHYKETLKVIVED